MFLVLVFLPPIILIGIALWLRQIWQFERYYDLVVVGLALGLGAWGGLLGFSSYGIFWYPCFLFNALVVGLFCTRYPIPYGLLASIAVAVGGWGCFAWYSSQPQETFSHFTLEERLRNFGGPDALRYLSVIGMALSFIPTVPIALYRDHRSEAKRRIEQSEKD